MKLLTTRSQNIVLVIIAIILTIANYYMWQQHKQADYHPDGKPSVKWEHYWEAERLK